MPQARRAFALQFGRFAVVGLANTATTYVAMWLLHAKLGIDVEVAGRSAYVIGAIQGFLLSRYWTFTHAGQGAVAPQVLGFIVVNLLCAALFGRAVVLLDNWLPLPLATVGATMLVIPVSFILYRWFVFRSKGKA
ncbi:GtrA family protein [Polymorphobacter arshaanensis]|uniref:GtrA family protein n=1 Tax=Glacieibacterium arshaanense TaxID=2511025 RepID=A0A4Y9ERP1_9SPHN|nr:GtrA family protein [Polymorphobacter arshaanensis]TFU06122.1 GtrA family protein [Polymorphobacter arshaanensis]